MKRICKLIFCELAFSGFIVTAVLAKIFIGWASPPNRKKGAIA